jgi:hypothetical protein
MPPDATAQPAAISDLREAPFGIPAREPFSANDLRTFLDFGPVAAHPAGKPEYLVMVREAGLAVWRLEGAAPTTREVRVAGRGSGEAKPLGWVVASRTNPERRTKLGPLHRMLEVQRCGEDLVSFGLGSSARSVKVLNPDTSADDRSERAAPRRPRGARPTCRTKTSR